MNDIRRTILWVIFGFSMVLLWDQWQVHNGKQATFFPSAKPPVTATAPGATGAASVPVASSGGVPTPSGTAGTTASALPGGAPAPTTTPRERITVETDVMRITFDSEGGSVIRTELLQHSADSTADKVTRTFVLLDSTPEHTYVAQSGLIGGDFPNHKTPMTFNGERRLTEGANEL